MGQIDEEDDLLPWDIDEARREIYESRAVIGQWKRSLIKIGHAAHRGDVEQVKELVRAALA